MDKRTHVAATLGLAALALAAPAGAQEKTMRVYHIGNSLTRNITPDRLHLLMAARGVDYQYGTQLSAGCTLETHWDYETRLKGVTRNWETNRREGEKWEPGEPDSDKNPKRFGPYDQALANHKWDALVLQPFVRHLKQDLPAARSFIRFAREHQATQRFFIYQTWPRRPEVKDAGGKQYQAIDYQALWERDYPFTEQDDPKNDDRYQSRAYFRKVVDALNGELTDLPEPVRMIPAGDVLYELDRRIKAGRIPGLAEAYARDAKLLPGWDPKTGIRGGANIFYADGIHLSPMPHLGGHVGNYAVALTFVAVFTGKSPEGLPGAVYGLDEQKDAALIAAVQKCVWDVVKGHPFTGVR